MNILLVDDHPIYCDGMKFLIASTFPAADIIAIQTVDDALNQAREIDVIVLDIHMEGTTTHHLIPALRQRHANTRILAITGYDDPKHAIAAEISGADGFMHKKDRPEDIEATLRLVAAGKKVFPSGAKASTSHAGRAGGLDMLTSRENEVVAMMSTGHSNKSIAQNLDISIKTVKTHLTNSYRKLGVASRMEAAAIFQNHLAGKPVFRRHS